jgi:hypothetical protein
MSVQTINSELAVARAELVTLTAKSESLAAAYRLNYGDDMAMVSGTRHKPNHRADARKWAACDKEADAWAAVNAKAAQIEMLEHAAKIAKRDALGLL